MSPMRTLAGLALVVAIATIAAEARTTAYNGYKVSADIPKDTWEYIDLELTASDFLGNNETADYKVFIETSIPQSYTTRLWFGTSDVTDTATAGEINPNATDGGRGKRFGVGSTPSPGNYVLSVYATCDSCNEVVVEVSVRLLNGIYILVPFMIRPGMDSVDLEVNQGQVLVWGFHDTAAVDDNIFVRMELINEYDTVDVVYEAGAFPTDVSDRYPTGASVVGNYLTDALAVEAGITYFGTLGVWAGIGATRHRVVLGINEAPSPLDEGPPNCRGQFTLADDDTDYSIIADCVNFYGSISIETSAVLDFSLPNLEYITYDTLSIQSPLSSLSLPALVSADRLIIGNATEICAIETLSLPSLTTIYSEFEVACQDLRVFDVPIATELGNCNLFWFGEDPIAIDLPCEGVSFSSRVPVDVAFTLETATVASVPSIAFGRISFPNLVSVTSGWAGFDLDISVDELMAVGAEIGDLEMNFPALTIIDGSLVAKTRVDGMADATATIFVPELTEVNGPGEGFDVYADGEVIPVAIVAPKLLSISDGVVVAGQAAVYFDALETITEDVLILPGSTVCLPALAAVGGNFLVDPSADTCIFPDVDLIEEVVAMSFSAPAAEVCTAEQCTAPTSLFDTSESGDDQVSRASLAAAVGVGLVTLACALVAAVVAVVIG